MNVTMKKMMSDHDLAVMKAIKTVHRIATENLPLSKYESFMSLLKNYSSTRPGLNCLQIGNHIHYQSCYSAKEKVIVLEEKTAQKLQKSPFVTIFADKSRYK
jgi:hypothetical protein